MDSFSVDSDKFCIDYFVAFTANEALAIGTDEQACVFVPSRTKHIFAVSTYKAIVVIDLAICLFGLSKKNVILATEALTFGRSRLLVHRTGFCHSLFELQIFIAQDLAIELVTVCTQHLTANDTADTI